MNLHSFLVDKKLETCTGPDIEDIVVGCLRRHKHWGDPSSVRVRELCNISDQEQIFFLPGGRWAIMFSRTGDAVAVDLHTPDLSSFHLFPSYPGFWYGTVQAAVQTQEAGFQTELKMAVYSESRNGARIQVWLIHPLYDTAGQVNGLTADCVSSFAVDIKPEPSLLSISGSFVGYLSRPEDEMEASAVLINWEEANGQEDFHKIPMRVVLSHDLNNGRVGNFLPFVTVLILPFSSSPFCRMGPF